MILANPIVVYAGNAEDNVSIDQEIGSNIGKNVTITENGKVDENEGNVSTNNGEIVDNKSNGDVDVNNGTIDTNNGNVDENNETIKTNSDTGTVAVNNGTVETNKGNIGDNFGTVGNNEGTVDNNFGGTVGGTAPTNQYHRVEVSGSNINASYSGFTERNNINYLNSTQSESYVTLSPASGYSLSGKETTGPVTSPDGYTYQIFRDSANNNNLMLMIGNPTGNQVINLSAMGIISQLIGGEPTTPTDPTEPTTPTDPTEPTTPTDPTTPKDPTTPTKPENTTNPGSSENKLATPISNGGLLIAAPLHNTGSACGGVSQYHHYRLPLCRGSPTISLIYHSLPAL